jgi:hypothetical protein
VFSLFVYSEILTKKKAILIGWLLINIFNLYASSSSVTNNHDFDNRCYNISVFHCIANICIFFIKPIEKFYFGCFYLTSMNMIVLILVIYSKLSTKLLYMASRAVESDKLSSLHLAKALYFVFNLFILKSQINDLAVLVNSTELS